MLCKKAQTSTEFLFLVGIAFAITLVFTSFTRTNINDLNSQKEYFLLKDVIHNVQAEIVVASRVEDGYTRIFEIPHKLEYYNYTINISGRQLIATSKNYEYLVNIPNITGSIKKGNNLINKSGGVIYLN